MTECHICGAKGIFLKTNQCKFVTNIKNQDVQCDKEVCDNCRYLIQRYAYNGNLKTESTICPSHIYKVLMDFKVDQLEELQMHGKIIDSRGRTIILIQGNDIEKILENAIDDLRIEETKRREEEIRKKKDSAYNLFKAERFEESAILFEELGMWEEAGKARRKEKVNVMKFVHINANDLFNQIKKEGLAIPYKCPNCAGVLKVTGDREFTSCPYCGSDLDLRTLSDLMDILR